MQVEDEVEVEKILKALSLFVRMRSRIEESKWII